MRVYMYIGFNTSQKPHTRHTSTHSQDVELCTMEMLQVVCFVMSVIGLGDRVAVWGKSLLLYDSNSFSVFLIMFVNSYMSGRL